VEVSTETASGEGRRTSLPLALNVDLIWNPKHLQNNDNDYMINPRQENIFLVKAFKVVTISFFS
jgi:hypothetical protein